MVDRFLVDYLKSGKAWVLVGSGPSIELGYPSWKELASAAIEEIQADRHDLSVSDLQTALKAKQYPKVFELAKSILGLPALRLALERKLKPTGGRSNIYELIARWPVPVYLTTNYDDELHKQLTRLKEAYIQYSNSAAHLAYLLPEFRGGIVKLHGDLRSDEGLILTESQYAEISDGDPWSYWRTTMTSVFRMAKMVVIGHSLSDPNIRHVLRIAKNASGVLNPICWIAPDVDPKQTKLLLEEYRIRVISYDNSDGKHHSLRRLLETISLFVPPRTSVPLSSPIARLSESSLGENSAAPGFFVFNKLFSQADYEVRRIEILVAAIQAAVPVLRTMGEFTLEQAFELSGWPKTHRVQADVSERVRRLLLDKRIFKSSSGQYLVVHEEADADAAESKQSFEHMRERFKRSLQLRAKQSFPQLNEAQALDLSADIESSLTVYFREGGLSLATILFSKSAGRGSTIPSSILKFINDASCRYNDQLLRLSFCSISLEAFVKAGSAERDYLGRIAQGFFCFQSLGVFGDVALERLNHAKETVWLIDSDSQIAVLALGAPLNGTFLECFSKMSALNIRVFTTESLFSETYNHFRFAENIIKDYGSMAPEIMAAARGELPFSQSNQFLEGFVQWQAINKTNDWESYLFQVFGTRKPTRGDLEQALLQMGIEVVALQNWPGFNDKADQVVHAEYIGKIQDKLEMSYQEGAFGDFLLVEALYKKAKPEAEAILIVKNEREGKYNILLDPSPSSSQAWFVSHTSILNFVDPGLRITWKPEAFLSFASTLSPTSDHRLAEQAFDTLLWGIAQSGISLLPEETIENVFGGGYRPSRVKRR